MMLSLAGECSDPACPASHEPCLDQIWDICDRDCNRVHLDADAKPRFKALHPDSRPVPRHERELALIRDRNTALAALRTAAGLSPRLPAAAEPRFVAAMTARPAVVCHRDAPAFRCFLPGETPVFGIHGDIDRPCVHRLGECGGDPAAQRAFIADHEEDFIYVTRRRENGHGRPHYAAFYFRSADGAAGVPGAEAVVRDVLELQNMGSGLPNNASVLGLVMRFKSALDALPARPWLAMEAPQHVRVDMGEQSEAVATAEDLHTAANELLTAIRRPADGEAVVHDSSDEDEDFEIEHHHDVDDDDDDGIVTDSDVDSDDDGLGAFVPALNMLDPRGMEGMLRLIAQLGDGREARENVNVDNYMALRDGVEADTAKAEDCSICLEPMKEAQKLATIECMHVYHAECLRAWFAQSLICPVCKYDVCRHRPGRF
jgi:hypothetical protein